MAKKKFFRKSSKIPLGASIGLAGTLLGGSMGGSIPVITYLKDQNWEGASQQVVKNITGYDFINSTWNIQNTNLLPLIFGTVVSGLLGKFVNKRIKLPYVKL